MLQLRLPFTLDRYILARVDRTVLRFGRCLVLTVGQDLDGLDWISGINKEDTGTYTLVSAKANRPQIVEVVIRKPADGVSSRLGSLLFRSADGSDLVPPIFGYTSWECCLEFLLGSGRERGSVDKLRT